MGLREDHVHRKLAERVPVVVGRDLRGMIETADLYLAAIEEPSVVAAVARILIDTADGLTTPFVGQIWVRHQDGNDLTALRYLEVVNASGRTADLAPIKRHIIKHTAGAALCIPLRSTFVRRARVLTGRQVSPSGEIHLDATRRATPWDGTPDYWTT